MVSAMPNAEYQLKDTRRRIVNVLDAIPAAEWTLAESTAVLDVLEEILVGRHLIARQG